MCRQTFPPAEYLYPSAFSDPQTYNTPTFTQSPENANLRSISSLRTRNTAVFLSYYLQYQPNMSFAADLESGAGMKNANTLNTDVPASSEPSVPYATIVNSYGTYWVRASDLADLRREQKLIHDIDILERRLLREFVSLVIAYFALYFSVIFFNAAYEQGLRQFGIYEMMVALAVLIGVAGTCLMFGVLVPLLGRDNRYLKWGLWVLCVPYLLANFLYLATAWHL